MLEKFRQTCLKFRSSISWKSFVLDMEVLERVRGFRMEIHLTNYGPRLGGHLIRLHVSEDLNHEDFMVN